MATNRLGRQNLRRASFLAVLGLLLFSGFLSPTAAAAQADWRDNAWDHSIARVSYIPKSGLPAILQDFEAGPHGFQPFASPFPAVPLKPATVSGPHFGAHHSSRHLPGGFGIATLTLVLIYLVISFEWLAFF